MDNNPTTFDITPNYANLARTFREQIVGSAQQIVRDVRSHVSRGLPGPSVHDRQVATCSLLRDANGLLSAIEISLASTTTVAEIDALRDELRKATEAVNTALRDEDERLAEMED